MESWIYEKIAARVREAYRWELAGDLVRWFALLTVVGELAGWSPLRVVSGRRTAEEQNELGRRWEAGQRAGLVARPAIQSRHLTGMAFDVQSNPDLEKYGALWSLVDPANRWGGGFSDPDPNHFHREA